MSLDLLDAPLRLTWEIRGQDQKVLEEAELLKIADTLVDAGIFYLMLDGDPLLHSGLPSVIESLTRCGCQISVVVGAEDAEREALKRIPCAVNLLVDAAPWLAKENGLAGLEGHIAELKSTDHALSLLWVPRAGQLHLLQPLLDICARLDLPRFKLPNYRIDANSEPQKPAGILQIEDLRQLERALAEKPLETGATALEVHDLFLWELIFPQGGGERSEYGGCQAGNSLGHITWQGDLWPCSSWPQRLGSLLETDLEALWDSPERFAIRKEVAASPADCAGCRDFAICFGGCRGLALNCRQDGGKRDLLCSGPRK